MNAVMPDDEFFEGAPVSDPPPASTSAPSPSLTPWTSRVVPCERDWFTSAPPKRTWFLRDNRAELSPGVIPVGKVGMLIGEGGVSKTMALVALALATVTGGSWLGAYSVAQPGRVLMLLGEEDADEVRRRCYSVARATKSRIPDVGSLVALPLAGMPCSMVETDERGNAIDAPFLRWLLGFAREQGPFALIIVDPLSRFAGVDAEIDNAAATRFVQALEAIAAATGATVMVAHHTNKTSRGAGAPVSGSSARGSSALFDGVRWAAALSAERVPCDDAATAMRLGEVVTLAVVKSNYSKKGEPLLLRRDPEHAGALLPLDDADHETIAAARAGAESGGRRAQRDEQAKGLMLEIAGVVRDVLRSGPPLSGRSLLAAVVARKGRCSRPVLEAALSSLVSAGEVRTMPGPDRSTLHELVT